LNYAFISRFNLIAQTRRRTFKRYLGIMSLQNIRHKAAALHQLPPKVEMILLKKGYSGSLPLCFRSLANLEMLSL
jgi:hypothetical protein